MAQKDRFLLSDYFKPRTWYCVRDVVRPADIRRRSFNCKVQQLVAVLRRQTQPPVIIKPRYIISHCYIVQQDIRSYELTKANKARCLLVPCDEFVRRGKGAIQPGARVRIIARHPPHLRRRLRQSCSVSDPTACHAY